jgi:anthranilate phosphoribosyltransferase
MYSITPILRRIARRRPGAALESGAWLDADEAQTLWGAALDGAVPDLELGALLATLSLTGESPEELLGLHRALSARSAQWDPGLSRRAVAIPVYGLFPGDVEFAALLALFLRRFGVPVVVHGPLEAQDGPSIASLLREFHVMPCGTLAEAGRDLRREGIAMMPAQLLSPAFVDLLALRARLSTPNASHAAAVAIDPGAMDAVRLAFSASGTIAARIAPFLRATEGEVLWLSWPQEAAPGYSVRPRIVRITDGIENTVFEAEHSGRARSLPQGLPQSLSWIRAVVERRAPAPGPLVNLAAACLWATGAAPDLTQAKAIVALHSGRIAA